MATKEELTNAVLKKDREIINECIDDMGLRLIKYWEKYGEVGIEEALKKNNIISKHILDLILFYSNTKYLGIPDSYDVYYISQLSQKNKEGEKIEVVKILGRFTTYTDTYLAFVELKRNKKTSSLEIYLSTQIENPIVR
jgi:hypothetical protein